MTSKDQHPPVADDDFAEFAEPPRHRPAPTSSARQGRPSSERPAGNKQDAVDDVIARLRRERAEGKR